MCSSPSSCDRRTVASVASCCSTRRTQQASQSGWRCTEASPTVCIALVEYESLGCSGQPVPADAPQATARGMAASATPRRQRRRGNAAMPGPRGPQRWHLRGRGRRLQRTATSFRNAHSDVRQHGSLSVQSTHVRGASGQGLAQWRVQRLARGGNRQSGGALLVCDGFPAPGS